MYLLSSVIGQNVIGEGPVGRPIPSGTWMSSFYYQFIRQMKTGRAGLLSVSVRVAHRRIGVMPWVAPIEIH